MNHIAKKQMSKALAGFLAIIMMLSLVPAELCATVFAAELSSYAVRVVDEKNRPIEDSVAVTLTNKEDNTKTQTQNTDKGIATFRNFVEEDAVYTVSVGSVTGYETLADYELSVAAGDKGATVQLTALEKVTISGTVTDENDNPYAGATVTLSGYLTAETTTGQDGRYSFEVFKGQDYTVTAVAKEPKYGQASSKFAAISGDTDCPLQFTVQSFTITTEAKGNGNITDDMSVQYGESATVEAVAADGYCIDEFTVDGAPQANAAGERSYSYSFKNVQAGHKVSVTFIRKSYKITFTVGKDGEVTYGDGEGDKVTGGSVNVERLFEESTDPTNPTEVTVTATPADNYRVSQVTIDGGDPKNFVDNDKEYRHVFEMNQDHSFSVVFSLNTYTVKVKAGKNGGVEVNPSTVEDRSSATVVYGGSATVTITPKKEYNIKSVTVNGKFASYEMNEDGKSYTLKLENIIEDLEVQVEFSKMDTIEGDCYSFNSGDAILTEKTDKYHKYVFDKKATVTFKPATEKGFAWIKLNDDLWKSRYSISESEEISEIAVFSNKDYRWYNVKLAAPKIIIVIDKDAPVVHPDSAELSWTKENQARISGTVEDKNTEKAPSSGLNCIVWATSSLTEAQVLAIAAGEAPSVDENVKTGKADIKPDTESKDGILTGTYSFDVEADAGETTYHLYAVDKSNNVSKGSKDATTKARVDQTAPTIDRFNFEEVEQSGIEKVLNALSFGHFFNKKIQVTVTASDSQSGVSSITLYVNNGAPITLDANDDGKATFVLPAEQTKLVDGEVYFNGTISATAADNVGNAIAEPVTANKDNSNNDSGYLMIETVKPVISDISVTGINEGVRKDDSKANVNDDETADVNDDKTAEADSYGTFSGDVKVTFKAQDADSGLASVSVKNNEEDAIKLESENGEYKFTTEEFNPDGSGKFNIVITAVDNAGNDIFKELCVEKDQTSPVVKSFAVTAVTADGDEYTGRDEYVGFSEAYGYYFKTDVKVRITAADIQSKNEAVSGVATIKVVLRSADGSSLYTIVDAEGSLEKITDVSQAVTYDVVRDQDENGNPTGDPYCEFTMKGPFKGQIFALATDRVGNNPNNSTFADGALGDGVYVVPRDGQQQDVLAGYAYPKGAILESDKEHEKAQEHIKFEKPTTTYRTADDGELYAGDVPVTITVIDTYSGIGSVEWSVKAPFDTDNNQSEKIVVTNDGVLQKAEPGRDGETYVPDSSWTVGDDERDRNLVTQMKKTINVTNNSNDIVVEVKLTDRAGNTTTKNISFSIDTTQPVIEVTYDKDVVPDAKYTNFFKDARTATVTIKERNFNEEGVKYNIESTDGVIPVLSQWTKQDVEEGQNPDGTVYTATITYEADGDYTFKIECTDQAGNKAKSFEPHTFTIDRTLPTVSVTYDNMSALNGNYFRADRTATITIVEHNFDPARVQVDGKAADNGAAVAFPAISAWTNNGDVHTATIHYGADARYTFDIAFADMAGNSIADYTPEEFYVDKTAPTLEIGGVADRSANNGTVAPFITFTDTNYNPNAITYTLVGVNNGTVTYDSSLADVANGQTVTFADFERVQQVDDIYTLTATMTDMAGNETTASITFSANRFGSVYDLSAMQKQNGKYLQTEENIVFTEVNVDTLKSGETKIKLTKNGTPRDLVEGKDYTIAVSGGNGQWSQYVYTISKSLFTDDGRYSISVYSVDAASNINENIDETKNAEISFGIDKTKPVIVPIDFESNTQYPVEVKTVSVEIKDNLVLEGVKIYLNGAEIQYTNDGETYTFDIPEMNEKQNVRIVAVDAAGNEYELSVEDFLVSTNVFVRWYNNTPLFVGSIVGIAVVCGFLIIVMLKRKKKTSEE